MVRYGCLAQILSPLTRHGTVRGRPRSTGALLTGIYRPGLKSRRYGGDIVAEKRIDVPDELAAWVEREFGVHANSQAEAYRMALVHLKRLEGDLEGCDDSGGE
jgi:hypothetical protein